MWVSAACFDSFDGSKCDFFAAGIRGGFDVSGRGRVHVSSALFLATARRDTVTTVEVVGGTMLSYIVGICRPTAHKRTSFVLDWLGDSHAFYPKNYTHKESFRIPSHPSFQRNFTYIHKKETIP